ncbi:hypothetical protein [Jiulongibacter sp. NS-SX5]|uniref:hypothetical protein n=1 Tax=Jiulongibacter sp. NS-SX5 TaxID=3463854 RepID=UPI00405811AB
MKKLVLSLMMVGLMSAACEKTDSEPLENVSNAETLADFECINEQADNPASLSDAQQWIVGTWQLTGVIAMIPDPQVPNISIEFKEDGGVFVSQDDEVIFTDAYSVIESEINGVKYLEIITDTLPGDFQENNMVKGGLRICENEMMIDQGIAFDAPGYLLRKKVD